MDQHSVGLYLGREEGPNGTPVLMHEVKSHNIHLSFFSAFYLFANQLG